MRKPRLVVVGGGVGGAAAVIELRKEGFDGGITLISAENTVPYERPPLSKEFLLGAPATDGTVEDAAWYEQQEIELLLGVRGTQLDLAARTITLSDGSAIGYDRLLLATGVRPRILPGIDGEGVCYLRTVTDATELRDRIRAAEHVAVLGGGFVGCEVAAAAIQLGKRTTILEALPSLLHRALGPSLGDVVAGIHRDEGVDVRTGQFVTGVQRHPRGGVRMGTAESIIDADVLVVGVGTVPNQELAELAGLPTGNGVTVDDASPPLRLASTPAETSPPSTCRGMGAASESNITTPPSVTGAEPPATCSTDGNRSATCTGSGPISMSTASKAPALPVIPSS